MNYKTSRKRRVRTEEQKRRTNYSRERFYEQTCRRIRSNDLTDLQSTSTPEGRISGRTGRILRTDEQGGEPDVSGEYLFVITNEKYFQISEEIFVSRTIITIKLPMTSRRFYLLIVFEI